MQRIYDPKVGIIVGGRSRRIEEITEHLPEFPRTLSLKSQALFSLGYYHQRASDRAQAAKRNELADTAPDTEIPEEDK